MSEQNKICIVFNGGSAGDFFTALLYQQIVNKDYKLVVDDIGTVVNQVSSGFKDKIIEMYLKEYDLSILEKINIPSVVNTHFCHQELLDLFPEYKFYYIDDSQCLNLNLDILLKKRFNNDIKELYLKSSFIVKKDKNLTKKLIENVSEKFLKEKIINNHRDNLILWKKLNLQSILFNDIIEESTCWKIISSICNDADYNKFKDSHSTWRNKNLPYMDQLNKTL